MFDFFLSPLSFLLTFAFYIASDIVKQKRWAKYCRYLAFLTFVLTISVWLFSFKEKMNAGDRSYHLQLVSSVTHHAEKLLINGEIEKAENILNRFNMNYWEYSDDNEALKFFLQNMKIPFLSREKESLEHIAQKINEGGVGKQTKTADTKGLSAD